MPFNNFFRRAGNQKFLSPLSLGHMIITLILVILFK